MTCEITSFLKVYNILGFFFINVMDRVSVGPVLPDPKLQYISCLLKILNRCPAGSGDISGVSCWWEAAKVTIEGVKGSPWVDRQRSP